MTDIEIAQQHKMTPIGKIAENSGIPFEKIEPYGHYKAKVSLDVIKENRSKLILVTAINPTPFGEGKTTVSIGLADGLKEIGKKVAIALREPSLGPVLGLKGGAAGGGYSQVVPMESINLHFNGDLHAITSANNLLSAMIDNHIFQGNALGIDPRSVSFKRCMDMNDRELRHIVAGLNGKNNGVPRQDGFNITAASEIMAIIALSSSFSDLKRRIGDIIVGYAYDNVPVCANQLKAQGAMSALLADALMPNLVQTLGGTPAFIHAGPFANIAHGCNSVLATRMAMSIADYTVTEAGFGADLGAEKFIDIKCRQNGLDPDAVVLVATVRALKYHGGTKKEELTCENVTALKKGLPNLGRHIENLRQVFGVNVAVAINCFSSDSKQEINAIEDYVQKLDVKAVVCQGWALGGKGMTAIAKEVVSLCDKPHSLSFPYELDSEIEEKVSALVKKIYGGKDVVFSADAQKALATIKNNGFSKLPVCVAKTQYSFSDDPKKLGCPSDFTVTVKDLRVAAGAGFVVVLTGDVMLMPGLPKKPAAENIDVDDNGIISGLF